MKKSPACLVIGVDGWVKQSWTLCFQCVLERCFLLNLRYVMNHITTYITYDTYCSYLKSF